MSAQSRSSLNFDLFYAGLGTAVGVAVILIGQGLWHTFTGQADGLSAAALIQPAVQAIPVPAQAVLASQAHTMGLPLVADTKAYWFMARAGGFVAYLLLWFATLWGIMMGSKLTKGALAFGLHEFLPILAMVFAALHAIVLLGDQYIGFSVLNLLVPFSAPYQPLWTGLGTLSLYLSVALIASFYVKSLVSRKVWRMFHYTAYLAFFMALVHGLMAGTDSSLPAVRWMYLLTGASLIFVTFFRILTAQSEQRGARRATVPLSVLQPQLVPVPVTESMDRRQTALARKQEILARRQAA